MVEETLVSVLKSNSINAYPNVKKEGDNSCLVYQLVSDKPYRNSQGIYLWKSHYLLSAYSTTYSAVKNLANSVISALDGNKNDFKTSWVTNVNDASDIDAKLSRVDIDLFILHD